MAKKRAVNGVIPKRTPRDPKDASKFLKVTPRARPRLHPAIDPCVQTAIALHLAAPENMAFLEEEEWQSFPELVKQLRNEVKRLKSGDSTVIEATLLGQSHALNALFVRALEWVYLGKDREAFAARMLFALKVQNHSRMTLETLARIRDPGRTTVIQQQQVVMQALPERVIPEAKLCEPLTGVGVANELLEVRDHERLDANAPATSGATNSPLETVDQRRHKDRCGKSDQ